MNICTFSCSEVNREEYKVIFSFSGVIFGETLLSIEAFYNVLIKGINSFQIFFSSPVTDKLCCSMQRKPQEPQHQMKVKVLKLKNTCKSQQSICEFYIYDMYISIVDLLVALPDEFFEINENDIRKMMVDLQKKV